MDTKSKFIVSADWTKEEVLAVAKSGVLPKGIIFKLDRAFFEQYPDKSIISTLQEMGYAVFVDAKISEVPAKVLKILDTYVDYRPFMINVMAGGALSTGKSSDSNINKVDCLKRFAERCEMYGIRSCAVTVLTSKAPDLVESEFCSRTPLQQVLWYVNKAYEYGITDIVCSPLECQEIRSHKEYDNLCLNTPGVRMLGTDVRDQARVTTPAQAIKLGANRIVVGSNLLEGEGDIVDRVGMNFEKIRGHIIEEAGVDVVDGITCT